MVVFVDTSAIYAFADRDDPNHERAAAGFAAVLAEPGDLLVHSYVILETVALLARRRGWDAVRQCLSDVEKFEVRWVDETLHRAAVERFTERKGRYSLVDEVSFLVMREHGIRHALACDRHFWEEGFLPYPS